MVIRQPRKSRVMISFFRPGVDVDVKVDAVSKMQAEFEAGIEVSLPSA